MPYTMTDAVTGNEFTFDDKVDPGKAKDIIMSKRPTPAAGFKLGSDMEGATPSAPVEGKDLPTGKDIAEGVMPYVRATTEGTGLALGSRYGGVRGAGLGYGVGKGAADTIEETAGLRPSPSLFKRFGQSAVDVGTGAFMEGTGKAAEVAMPAVIKAFGKVGRALMGRITGTGVGSVEEAVASGAKTAETGEVTVFDKASRSEIPGDEIVNHARTALQAVKDQRATAYKTELSAIQAGPQTGLDISPIRKQMADSLEAYGLKVDADGVLGPKYTGSVLSKSDMAKMQELVDTTFQWGRKAGDRTPAGVDTLKQFYDNFYSDSSAIRQIVASMRNKARGVLVDGVPGYENMTKGYEEATNMLKDFESGLMLRKQGMSGRVTADQTLRRLVSSMKDNYEMRRDLVKVLGEKGGTDLTGEVAGYTMSQVLPRGLAGESPFLIGEVAMAYKLLSPQWWPILALSSPRVAAEFLKIIGSTAYKVRGAAGPVSKTIGYGIGYGTKKLVGVDAAFPEDTVPPAQPE